ncbi:peroxisomal targeting signal 1 receptor isoform X2 [Folsomia candida]|uniref:peroxisomal targeting signal 1 receptor isoform X2 n=1 Tax=Folsomia candida TaxID=158441 RepID=UPI000B8F75A9|nr:peroxisomal targeting signal 1 receptor isoform X2 [Folsomia candida]
MSMRDFLDGECGQNPVLKVATHFTRDSLSSDLGQSSRHAFFDAAHNVSQLPPTTFQMDNLLKEIHAMGQTSKPPVQAPTTLAELAANPAWAEEFIGNEQRLMEPRTGQESWIQDYLASKDSELDNVWDHHAHHLDTHHRTPHLHPGPIHAIHHPDVHVGQASARDLLDDSRWLSQYESDNNLNTNELEKTELMITAEEFIKSVSDPKIKATEFMNFVEKLSTGEIGADGQHADARSQQWASEYENEVSDAEMQARRNGDWADEYVTGNGGTAGSAASDAKQEFWHKLNDEWEKLARDDSANHPWLVEPSASKVNEPYQFSEDNAFKESEDPFEEGKRKLLAGDIPSAALLFEAAVLKHPDHAESWMFLGTTQALNEQDLLSISALNKCLQLSSGNLTALMSLATSLTNESFHLQACNALKRWLKHNDRYSYIVSEELGDMLPQTTSLLPSEELQEVQRMFMQAARINPTEGVDPDVQCGLGILFSLGTDFDKAADCFQSALGANPENPLLWNRLGATLANGGKSSEAIGAYRRALELSPGYVRTRYNLGIACVNLGAYREASEHFLTALNMQSNGKSQSTETGRDLDGLNRELAS